MPPNLQLQRKSIVSIAVGGKGQNCVAKGEVEVFTWINQRIVWVLSCCWLGNQTLTRTHPTLKKRGKYSFLAMTTMTRSVKQHMKERNRMRCEVRSRFPPNFPRMRTKSPTKRATSLWSAPSIQTGKMKHENTKPHPVTEIFSNLVATYAPSPTEVRSKVLVRTSNDFSRTSSIGAVAGINILLGNDSVVDFGGNNGPLPIAWPDTRTSGSYAVAPSVTTSMVVAPAASNTEASETSKMTDHFRFSQPKLFVGSRSKQAQPKHVTEPSPGIALTKRWRGRPRKRTNDGRADIRALPNYTGDLLEDFEDGGRVHEDEKALRSLFPMLELTDGRAAI